MLVKIDDQLWVDPNDVQGVYADKVNTYIIFRGSENRAFTNVGIFDVVSIIRSGQDNAIH